MSTSQSSAKYAVIRLKRTDDVLELFQLLIRNGFAEVSFVNALNETIFPAQNRNDKTTQTQETALEKQQLEQQPTLQPQPSNQQIRQTRLASPASSANSSDAGARDSDQKLLRLNLPNFGAMATLPTIPSSSLLPTMSSLLAAAGQHAYSNRPMFHETMTSGGDTTPPYTLTFSTHGLFTPPIPAPMPTQISLPLQSRPITVISCGTGTIPSFSAAQIHHRQNEVLRTSSSSEILFNSGLLPGSATTQLRQRGQRACIADDPSLYVICRMCKNKIMGSRISNLTNHVRRHSTLKQFQCCYCDYTHNEMAKVRLHMLHNHKDKDSQPVDNISPEMQIAWDILMKECFPEHCQSNSIPTNVGRTRRSWKQSCGHSSDRSSESDAFNDTVLEHESPSDSSINIQRKEDSGIGGSSSSQSVHSNRMIQNDADFKPVEGFVRCIECGQAVHNERRLHHIQKYHMRCLPFACSLCSYGSVEHCKVSLHVSVHHKDDLSGRVISRNADRMAEFLLPTYFSSNSSECSAFHRISHSPSESPSEIEVRTPPDRFRVNTVKHERYSGHDFDRAGCSGTAKQLNLRQTNKFRCHLCLKAVTRIQSVASHARRHARIKWYKCATCHYRSCNYKRVCKHMASKHEGSNETPRLTKVWKIERPWKCFVQQCFFNPLRVKPPIIQTQLGKKHHRPVNNYLHQLIKSKDSSKLCNLCGSKVSMKNLTKHVRLHCPQNSYGCSICAFLTSDLVQARIHLWKHKVAQKLSKKAKVLRSNDYANAHFELCFG